MPLLTLSWAVQASAAQDRPMLTPHFPREHELWATGITKPAFWYIAIHPQKVQKRRIPATWHTFEFTLTQRNGMPNQCNTFKITGAGIQVDCAERRAQVFFN
jgi:hypothetical protein